MKEHSNEVLNELLSNKKLNLFSGRDKEFEFDRIKFGIPALDKLTGGGIPKKRMTLLYGPTNVG